METYGGVHSGDERLLVMQTGLSAYFAQQQTIWYKFFEKFGPEDKQVIVDRLTMYVLIVAVVVTVPTIEGVMILSAAGSAVAKALAEAANTP